MNSNHDMSPQPLLGRRVLVTRAPHQAAKLSDGLRARGAVPVEVPVLDIAPPVSFDALDQALLHLESYQWLIVTSANAVEAIAVRCNRLSLALDGYLRLKVAAIGRATAAAVEALGLRVALTPARYQAESLAEALLEQVNHQRVLLVKAAVSRDVIPEALRRAGAELTVADAYQTILPRDSVALLQSALASGLDAVTFTSSSSARHLAQVAAAAGFAFPLPGVAAVSIGEITSATLRELGWEPAGEARVSDIAGLLDAVTEALNPGK